MEIICTKCHQAYPDSGAPYCCVHCSSVYDYSSSFVYKKEVFTSAELGIWRHSATFGLPNSAPIVTLGEGNTPLVWVEGRIGVGEQTKIGLKCEHINPTGSFKDRGTPLIISFLISRGVKEVLEDSSGNAGASFAAYAARAGLKATVFIPDSASGPKMKQIKAFGAKLVLISGPRSNATEAVRNEIENIGIHGNLAYASHAYLPVNLPGYATIAYELIEQLAGDVGTVIVPVGQGGLFLGLARGFEALLDFGSLRKMPYLIGVQAQACAPLWSLIRYGNSKQSSIQEKDTIAEGIRVRYPLRVDSLVKVIEKYNWNIVLVDDTEIRLAFTELARKGIYVEPTSAVVWAALAKIQDPLPEPVIAILTGSGLKTSL